MLRLPHAATRVTFCVCGEWVGSFLLCILHVPCLVLPRFSLFGDVLGRFGCGFLVFFLVFVSKQRGTPETVARTEGRRKDQREEGGKSRRKEDRDAVIAIISSESGPNKHHVKVSCPNDFSYTLVCNRCDKLRVFTHKARAFATNTAFSDTKYYSQGPRSED